MYKKFKKKPFQGPWNIIQIRIFQVEVALLSKVEIFNFQFSSVFFGKWDIAEMLDIVPPFSTVEALRKASI